MDTRERGALLQEKETANRRSRIFLARPMDDVLLGFRFTPKKWIANA
jgi:hypothetical protein